MGSYGEIKDSPLQEPPPKKHQGFGADGAHDVDCPIGGDLMMR
jgi:hypothetical protein